MQQNVIAEILAWSEDQVERIIRRYVDRPAATKAIIRQLNQANKQTWNLGTRASLEVGPGARLHRDRSDLPIAERAMCPTIATEKVVAVTGLGHC